MAALQVEANGVPLRYLPSKPARIKIRSNVRAIISARKGRGNVNDVVRTSRDA